MSFVEKHPGFVLLGLIALGVLSAWFRSGDTAPIFNTVTHKYTFGGFECLDDCGGQQAGYQYAKQHDIVDEDDCQGYSNSFIEGCKVWAAEATEALEDLNDSSPDGT